jgi:hypothetical protein
VLRIVYNVFSTYSIKPKYHVKQCIYCIYSYKSHKHFWIFFLASIYDLYTLFKVCFSLIGYVTNTLYNWEVNSYTIFFIHSYIHIIHRKLPASIQTDLFYTNVCSVRASNLWPCAIESLQSHLSSVRIYSEFTLEFFGNILTTCVTYW